MSWVAVLADLPNAATFSCVKRRVGISGSESSTAVRPSPEISGSPSRDKVGESGTALPTKDMMELLIDSGDADPVGVSSVGVADNIGDAGTEGNGENVVLKSGDAGVLLLGSENSRRRWLEVARLAFSLSDGMNVCSKLPGHCQ